MLGDLLWSTGVRTGLAMVGTLLLGCQLPTGGSGELTTGSSATTSTDETGPGLGETTAPNGGSTGVGTGDGGSTHGELTGTETGSTTTTGGDTDGDTTAGIASAGSTSSGGPLTCDELYGNAPGYVLCEQTDRECRFNATTGGGTCNQMCTDFGGTCLAAFDNPNTAGQECIVLEPNKDTCETPRTTELCVCSR